MVKPNDNMDVVQDFGMSIDFIILCSDFRVEASRLPTILQKKNPIIH